MKIPEKQRKIGAREIALVAIMAATIECGKLVLSVLPNIEIVTILCALYGYIFGVWGVVASIVFVCMEPLIYGFGSWTLTYFIYWPLVATVFMLLRRKKWGGRLISTLTAIILTLFFGVISSIIDGLFLFGINEYFIKNIVIYYLRGIPFYITQLVTNAVVFPMLFPFLLSRLDKIRQAYDL